MAWKPAKFSLSPEPKPLNPTPPISVSNERLGYVSVTERTNRIDLGSFKYVLYGDTSLFPEAVGVIDAYFSEDFSCWIDLPLDTNGYTVLRMNMKRASDNVVRRAFLPTQYWTLTERYGGQSYDIEILAKLGAINSDGVTIFHASETNIHCAMFGASALDFFTIPTTQFENRSIDYVPIACGKTFFGVSGAGDIYDIAYNNGEIYFRDRPLSIHRNIANSNWKSAIGAYKDNNEDKMLVFNSQSIRAQHLTPDEYRNLV